MLYNSTAEDLNQFVSIDNENFLVHIATTDKKFIGQYIFTLSYYPESDPSLIDDSLTIDLLVLELLSCFNSPAFRQKLHPLYLQVG